ncbi:SWPV1-095 [Shearwaterpox virus]|uniref:Entry-fusion complex protein OPG086 n=1 Tax=Shearwaterpox virus TaxID=1974596 RepID=A0A1V0S7U9_CNPV|nr:SWPV1-095 [Shearwaterpox virus]
MTFFLILFLVLFLILCYFLNFKRTNKMDIGINPITKIPWTGNDHIFVSTLFQDKNTYVTGPMKLKYDPEKKSAVIDFKNTTYNYDINNFKDVRKLIPTLLLSK